MDHDPLLNQPPPLRLACWIAIGKALGLPVSEWLEAIDIQLAAAKRAGTRPVYTPHERMRLGHLAQAITGPLRGLVTWITSPAAMIRWLIPSVN
jgi:hypothetical protein